FRAVLSELKNTIPSCQFLAIDGEFTGLLVGDKINAYDSPAKQFSKMRQESMEYLLIEFGLCVFHYNKEKNSTIQNECQLDQGQCKKKWITIDSADPRECCGIGGNVLAKNTVHIVLKKDLNFRPWKLQNVQELSTEDCDRLV
ncbi:unnamed protein product, partial [Timema podura]|nr:unnamed protein product [Timema podura]